MAYTELIARSCFSLLQGASTPEELMAQASACGVSSLGIVDRDAVYGLVRAHKAAKKHGIQLLCGATMTIEGHPPLSLLVEDEVGWRNLCRLITSARSQCDKGFASMDVEAMLNRSDGLTAIVHYGWGMPALERLREAFPNRLALMLTRHRVSDDRRRARWANEMSQSLSLPRVASNDVVCHVSTRHRIADVLTCIRLGVTVERAGRRLSANAERVLQTEVCFRNRFSDVPDVLQHAERIAERCQFSLDSLRYTYPQEVVPDGWLPMDWLAELVRRGLVWRYPEGVSAGVRQRVQHELGLIETLNFSHYFLTVYDVVRFARSQGILCQGRGSAANSAVCYALGITAVDPNCSSLLFERFISAERGEPPDIDVDFEHERREEVIQYIYERYGRHRAALTNEFITYRMRSAIRDVGKVFGLSLDQVERLAGATHRLSAGTRAAEEELVEEAGLDPSECLVRKTIEIAREIKGLPRHVSIHVGGFVISNDVLIDLVPVEPATMEGRTVIQWDKDDIAALGFVKVDVLGLGMLTAIRKGLCLIEQAGGPAYCLATVPPEDSLVYDMFCRADTVGVFQIESRAQMSMLPRLKPRCFYDLVIEVAIVRPGPIQGGMVHPYLSRRSGQTPITYAHPDLHPILDRTLGVPLFQEQVMQMAVAVGGFTPGEADALRRAMGAWRKRGTLDGLGRRLVQAMLERGISSHYAESIFAQIKGFGEYGFPESHAASFALLVYVSGWMKCHYPAAFAAALINSQPMGFYSARSIVSDAERHEVCVRPICVGSSEWNCTLEGGYDEEDGVALRLGFRLIRGLGERDVNAFVKERKRRPFQSLMDFASRSGLSRRSLEAFASANALSLFGVDRRTALWKLLGRWERLPLFEHHARCEPEPELPFETDRMSIERDYQTVGLSVGKHPMQIVRPQLDIQIQPLSHITGMKSGEYVCIAGLVTSRQRPGTANGVVFITLEDESALVNLVVWPRVWEEQRKLARTSVLLGVKGVIQKDGAACSVLVHQFWSVDRSIVCVETNARDFR